MGGGQRRSSAFIWGVAAAIVLFESCGGAWAATYEVGGTGAGGWTIPNAANGLDYTRWADSNTYRVNDVLHFTYANAAHNVQPLPTSASYDSCDLTVADATLLETSGDTSITLTTAGPAYFVCEIPGHCGLGMKFQINVLAATASPSSSPSGTPVSSPAIGAPVSSPAAGTPESSPTTGTPISSPRPLGPRAPAPVPQDSSAPLSTLVSGSLAVVVLASTMLLSSLV